MFRQDFKDNLKNKIMRNKRILNDMFDFIKVVIDFDNKLYERVIKKKIQSILRKNRNFL